MLYDYDAPAGMQHIFLVTVNIISYIQSTFPHLSKSLAVNTSNICRYSILEALRF